MLKSEAAAYLAGVTQTEGAEASAPTNLHVITGEVGEMSEDGKALVKIDGLMFSESDDQYIEIDALGGLEEGDIATLILTGEQGHAMTPLALGSIGSIDRITVRISEIEADYIKVEQLEAAEARIGDLEADHVSTDDLDAATARIGTLETTRATITDLEAAEARIHELEVDHVSIDDFEAEQANIDQLQANTADIGTIRANSAKVQNLTAAQLEADHATIGSLSTNYAHITNGVIDNAKIGYADVNNLSAHYAEIQNGKINSALIDTAAIVDEQVFTVTGNKATLAQIDASKINVLNLKAKDIEVERINGQPVTNKTLVDALSQHESDISDLDTKIDNEVEALNDRIDGAIETFTGTVVPTLENTPASQWNTVALKDQHVGDVYYVVNSQSAQNGYCYRFTKSGSTYSWQLIKDSDVTAALSRLQTAEGKIGNIEQFDETVGSFMTDTDDELSSLKTRATSLETSLGDKVDTSTFNTVSQKVDANEANITSMSTVLTNNGLTSSTNITNTVNTVKQTADTNKASITSLTQTVNNKADSTTVTTLTNRVSTVEQNLDGITTRVGKTESELDTVSNPNLSPFFSHSVSDVYSADNPDGYWHNSISTSYITELNDGWAHINLSNTGTSNLFANYFVVKSVIPESFKPSTKYTFLVETRNVTKSGTITVFATHNFTSQIHAFTASASFTLSGDENKYLSATSVSNWSSAALFTRGYVQVPGGASVEMDIRISLYEGEYSGPYKPYVDQTLSNRVKSAETSIEQNAEDITLRATKTEAYQSAQPNLSPFFQSTPITTAGGYWIHFGNSSATFTPTGDGWCRIVLDNTSGTGVKRCDFDMDMCPSVEPGKDYTLLYEVRNIACSGSGAQTYVVQAGNEMNRGIQFWGNSAHTLLQGYGTNCAVEYIQTASGSGSNRAELCDDGIYRKRIVRKSESSDSTYYTRATDKELMRLVAYANAGAYIDVELRVSLYPGVYTGPYKPYSGAQLYASQSELKVANDNINLKVSKNDVINQINVSTEGVKIDADRVTIDGTAVFNAAKSKLDAAYDAKGAATTAENNAKAYTDALEIGGRNLLLATGTSQSKTMPAVAAGSYTTWDPYTMIGAYSTLGLTTNDSITVSFDWSVTGAAAGATVKIGTNAVPWEYFGVLITFAAGASSGHVEKTFAVSSGLASSTGTTLRVRIDAVGNAITTSMVLTISNAKLEKGTKATDWTPAPEDVAANAVKRTQRIWYRTNGSSAPDTPGTASSNWVTKADDGNDAWTKMHVAITSTHKRIYTCEQYEMANGTVGYTSVLLDNTITVIDGGNIITGSVMANKLNAADINASKTLTVGAMTDAAASTILNSNVQIGGRNLLFQTENFSKSGTSTSYFIEHTVSNGALKNSVVLEAGVEYTFSADVTSSREPFQMTIGVGNGIYSRDISYGPGETLTSGRVSITFTPTSAQLANGAIFAFRAPRYGTQGTSFTYAVAHPKLEKGNKTTDWTPAPEDVDANVNEVNASLAATEESLSQQIQGTNDGLSSVSATVTQLNTIVQQDRADMGRWLNFNESEGLTIGKAGSAFKVVTDETRQAFMYGNETLAYTSGDRFVAPRMEADELHIGNWMWVKRDNGNLSLKWIG